MIGFAFYSFTTTILGLLTFLFYKYLPNGSKKKAFLFFGIIILFQIVVGLLGRIDFYVDFNLPPKMVVAGIFPAFIILGSMYFSKTQKELKTSLPIHIPIIFQSFRIIVELFILWTWILGWGPKEATFLGYNYEFYFGIIALTLGVLVWQQKVQTNRILLAFNILGLFMLAFIVGIFFSSAFFYDSVWGNENRMVTAEMMRMPALSIATLYMPLAVWTHIFSIRQIRHKKNAGRKVSHAMREASVGKNQSN